MSAASARMTTTDDLTPQSSLTPSVDSDACGPAHLCTRISSHTWTRIAYAGRTRRALALSRLVIAKVLSDLLITRHMRGAIRGLRLMVRPPTTISCPSRPCLSSAEASSHRQDAGTAKNPQEPSRCQYHQGGRIQERARQNRTSMRFRHCASIWFCVMVIKQAGRPRNPWRSGGEIDPI